MTDDEEEEDVTDDTDDNTCIVFQYKEEHELPEEYIFGQIYLFKGILGILPVLLAVSSISKCNTLTQYSTQRMPSPIDLPPFSASSIVLH